jgi:ribosomal protein L32
MSNLSPKQFPEIFHRLESDPETAGNPMDVEHSFMRHTMMQDMAKEKGYSPNDVKVDHSGESHIEHRLGSYTGRYRGYNVLDIHHDSVPDAPNVNHMGRAVLASLGIKHGPVASVEVIKGVGNYVPNLEKAHAKIQSHHIQSALENYVNSQKEHG